MISFPYPKSLTANPFVNQGAALLVTDADTAARLGIPEDRWVHPIGGAGADEPTDPRARAAYHHVPALDVTVRDVQEVTGTTADEYDVVELYSCFPAMPKLTAPRARPRRDRADLGDRWALVLRWTRQQLPHALAGGDGRAHPRRRWHRASCTASGCSTPSTTRSCSRDHPRDDGAYPAPRHDVGVPRPPVTDPVPVVEDYAGPATVRHVHGGVRP